MTDSKHIVGPTERREEIARIIDPTLWRALDFRGALPEGYREHALDPSLAKADAILASDGGREMVRELVEALDLARRWVDMSSRFAQARLDLKLIDKIHAKAKEWLEGKG